MRTIFFLIFFVLCSTNAYAVIDCGNISYIDDDQWQTAQLEGARPRCIWVSQYHTYGNPSTPFANVTMRAIPNNNDPILVMNLLSGAGFASPNFRIHGADQFDIRQQTNSSLSIGMPFGRINIHIQWPLQISGSDVVHILIRGLRSSGPIARFDSFQIWGGPFGPRPPIEKESDHIASEVPKKSDETISRPDTELSDQATRSKHRWTEWMSRDDQYGSGDYEETAKFIAEGKICSDPLAIECRTIKDRIDWQDAGQNYSCTVGVGGVCSNRGQTCKDYEVRYRCVQSAESQSNN